MKITHIAIFALVSSADAFSSKVLPKETYSGPALFDPLGLYPQSAPERIAGRIKPLERITEPRGPVKDPLGIYPDATRVDNETEMSPSLPFNVRPSILSNVPGDRGFDPFNFAANENSLQWMRSAEVKHARLAMLAAAGWPLSELLDKKLAYLAGLKPLLVFQDRVPSVLNGGLGRTPPAFWAATLGVAFAIETLGLMRSKSAEENGVNYTPGDLGFDPFNLSGKTAEEKNFKLEAELFNGRLAMLAITGFALQEFWTVNSVINETPIFFKPINIALEQLAAQAAEIASNGM